MPNDPAIMQMQLPPQHIGQQPFQPPQFTAGPMAGTHMGNAMGPGGPFSGPYGAMGSLGALSATGLAPGSLTSSASIAGGISKAQKQASELNTAILQPSSTSIEYKDQGGNGNFHFF